MRRLILAIALAIGLLSSSSAALITGVCGNVHSVYFPNAVTLCPWLSAVRIDDAGPGSFSMATQATLVANYRSLGLKIRYILDGTWGANVVGHARDILTTLHPDELELYNEPQLAPYNLSAASFFADQKVIYQNAGRWLPGVFIVAPSIPNWDDTAQVWSGQTWLKQWIALGGLQYCDAVSIHPYYPIATAPEILSTYASQARALVGSKPITFTEVGAGTANVEGINGGPGSWTAARAADSYNRLAVAAAGAGVSVSLYDIPHTTNGDGYGIGGTDTNMAICTTVTSGVNTSLTAMGSALATAMSLSGIHGVGG